MKDFSRAAFGLAVLFTGFINAAGAYARPEDALGHWSTPSKHGVVDITACGTGICGHLLESDAIHTNPDARDTHNNDAALRNRPLKGVAMLAGFARAATSPLQYPSYLHGTRRVLLKKFPFFIVFLDWQDEIYIVAVAHAKRRPGYWVRRVGT